VPLLLNGLKAVGGRPRYNKNGMKLEIELEVPDSAFDKFPAADLIRSVKEQTALNL
jgi:hypothetical protein